MTSEIGVAADVGVGGIIGFVGRWPAGPLIDFRGSILGWMSANSCACGVGGGRKLEPGEG
jgi:hypothetical protein